MIQPLLFIGLTFNTIVGLVVLLNNPSKLLNRLLFSIALTSNFWLVANYLADRTSDYTLLWNRLSFVGPLFFVLILLWFVTVLGNERYSKIRLATVGAATTLLSVVSVATNWVVEAIQPRLRDGVVVGYDVDRGLGSILLSIWFALGAFLIFWIIYDSWRKSTSKKRFQLKSVMIGFILAGLSALTTNVAAPLITGSSASAALAPVATIFFIGFLAFAIVRHGLFNIRMVVARSVGYLLSVLSVALLFASAAFLLVNLFTEDGPDVDAGQQVFFTLIAVLLAFVFQPVKRFFDKLSNRIFYRDAYDTQEFLDDFNKVLVSKVDLEPMLEDITHVIGDNLKNSFTSFFIRKTQYIDTRLLGDDIKNFDEKDFLRIGELVSHIHQSVIVLDELDGEDDLKALMQKHDIAVIARLVTTIEYDLEGVGFLALGQKRSGSPYTRQDVKMMEIIANELVIAIQNALRFEEIQEFNITLQEKVDDATKRLRRSNEKLKEMDETKDEFISMASHQLRTPLTSVKGYLSMVLEGDAGDIKPMQEKLLSQAFTSSQRMVYLIADLLNVSRLRTGKFIIEPIRANLADIAAGEVEQLQETASSRKLTLEYEKPVNFPDLMLDETKIRQVIMNFIDNAIYYTQSDGTITVALEDKKDSVELTVTDTGMGVPKADQPNLFTKFYRAGNAKKARPDGTGLGLFMAKKVIIEQGGAVIFKSKEGEGSTFGFTLPKDKLTPEETVKKDTDKPA